MLTLDSVVVFLTAVYIFANTLSAGCVHAHVQNGMLFCSLTLGDQSGGFLLVYAGLEWGGI